MAGIGEFIKDSFPRGIGLRMEKIWNNFQCSCINSLLIFHNGIVWMSLCVWICEGNLSNLWLTNWRIKKLKKKGSQFIWKYFYSENCFKFKGKHIYLFEEKGGEERSSCCLFLCVHGRGLEDHRVRKKIQIANIAWGGAFKKVETKYWNHTWCLSKWMKSNFAL